MANADLLEPSSLAAESEPLLGPPWSAGGGGACGSWLAWAPSTGALWRVEQFSVHGTSSLLRHRASSASV